MRSENIASGTSDKPKLKFNRIVAIDPGGTTGVASKINGEYNTYVLHDEEELWHLINEKPDLVICENFVAELISKYGLYTVQLVGGIKALCYTHNIPLVIQMPQKRIAFVKPAKEMIRRGHPDHEHDALAHLLAFEYWSEREPVKFFHYD